MAQEFMLVKYYFIYPDTWEVFNPPLSVDEHQMIINHNESIVVTPVNKVV